MRRKGLTLSSLLLTSVLAVSATACGNDSDSADDPNPEATSSHTPSTPEETDSPLTQRIKAVNKAMASTSFHASGTTTALGGGKQEMWSDPKHGMRIKMTGKKSSGDIYCKNGTSYMSAAMVADTVNQQGGIVITVPDRLADVWVTSDTGQGCDVFYQIAETAKLATTEEPRKVAGKDTTALSVSEAGAEDLYLIENGAPHLLQQRSTRDGRTSTTTYDSFGKKVTVKVPTDTMPMDEFRKEVIGS